MSNLFNWKANDTLSNTIFYTFYVISWNLFEITNFGGFHISFNGFSPNFALEPTKIGYLQ